jgi:hypothetical protein
MAERLCQQPETWKSALDHARQQLSSLTRLTALEPLHQDWQRSLALAHQQLGICQQLTEDLPAAATSYRTAAEMLEAQSTATEADRATLWLRVVSASAGKVRQEALTKAKQWIQKMPEGQARAALEKLAGS